MRLVYQWSLVALCSGLISGCLTPRPTPVVAPAPVEVAAEVQPNVDDAFKDAFRPSDSLPETPENVTATDLAASPPARAEYVVCLAQIKKELNAGNPAQASARVATLTKLAQGLGESEKREATTVAYQVALATGDLPAAAAQARLWLSSCGPLNIDGCRKSAREALRATAVAGSPEAAALEAELTEAHALDACVVEAEASPRSRAKSSCLAPALANFQLHQEAVMVARVQLLLATSARSKEAEAVLLTEVVTGCTEPACVDLRETASARLGANLLSRREYRAAATTALAQMHAAAELLPLAARRHARTPEVEKTCAAYERHTGKGACRALEVSLFGTYSLPDLSREKADKPYLTATVIKRATAQYQETLFECVATAAASLGQPTYVNFNLHWVVRGDGRVVFVETDSSELNRGATGTCLRGAFSLWRYPRFAGEPQHVRQNFRMLVSKAPAAVAKADGNGASP